MPRSMIEQATERRLAGDWRGACAAANVDVEFDRIDPAWLPGAETAAWLYGGETAARLEEDLRHLAPDLVRWHLPRYLRGRTTLRPKQCVILAGYSGRPAEGPYLYVTTAKMIDGPQRLTLHLGVIDGDQDSRRAGQVQDWRFARHLWDTRHTDELVERCGGGARAPFRNADGTPRGADEMPVHDPGPSDPAGHTEWVTMLLDRGDVEQAFGAVGITLDDTPPQSRYSSIPPFLEVLGKAPFALTTLEPEAKRLASGGLGGRFLVRTLNRPGIRSPVQVELDASTPGVNVRLVAWDYWALDDKNGRAMFPEALWRRLPDLDLLRFGDITPEELHPLVSASLFPARARRPADRLPGPDCQPAPAVRVRCRGEWHEVRSQGGRLSIPHTDEEERRERAMRAFGGQVNGCFAASQAWTSGAGWLPKGLRAQRSEFFSRIQQGDIAEVLRLLDAGIDPRIRDGRQRTLLHLLHLLDHEAVLPKLLAAGLDLEARDHHQRTPLHVAVGEGPVALVHALLDAGARTDVVDHQKRSLPVVILRHKRKELRFLKDAVIRDHYPDLANEKYLHWEELDD